MTFLTFSQMWSLLFFSPLCYGLLVVTFILYMIPVSGTQFNSLTKSYSQSNFKFVSGHDVYAVLAYAVLFALFLN